MFTSVGGGRLEGDLGLFFGYAGTTVLGVELNRIQLVRELEEMSELTAVKSRSDPALEATKESKLLKRLPIPPLEDTLKRYLDRVQPLQDEKQFKRTKRTVMSAENLDVMRTLQEKLLQYDQELANETPESSYIEQFWYDSYLLYDQSVVLNVNPYFQLEDDPTILKDVQRDSQYSGPYGKYTLQIKRCAKLVTSILKFIKQVRHGTLAEDKIRTTPLSMDQYKKLFGSSRIPPGPGEESCHLQTDPTSHHIMVMYKSQFYWFDVLDINNFPIFQAPEELEWNLYSIIMDTERHIGDHLQSRDEFIRYLVPMGVFTTESRRVWSNIRDYIYHDSDSTNWKNLKLIDSALFVICLDDLQFDSKDPKTSSQLVQSMLCGTSNINLGEDENSKVPLNIQHGTCMNRWFEKLQLIVTRDGKAGINFEHTGVDGHTVLRFATDIYTDSILSFARGVTKNVPDIFAEKEMEASLMKKQSRANLITIPRKLEWRPDSFLLSSLHFAETRISDLISQYEFVSLDFETYGAAHIKAMFKCSPDAFTQQVFQIAYYALYGKFEAVYEPAMTKTFQNGRTETIRSVTNQSKKFVKSMFDSKATNAQRIDYLQKAAKEHSRITKECSMGLGQDRHLYALYCVWNEWYRDSLPMPPLFQDHSWSVINNNVLSTSNCGNPCLKNFGFGPVTANGFGIGYVIREDSISIVVSSRHRQTERFVSLLEKSFLEIDRIFRREHERQEALAKVPIYTPQDDKDKKEERENYLRELRKRAGSMSQNTKSDDLQFLLSGYDYFDISVSG